MKSFKHSQDSSMQLNSAMGNGQDKTLRVGSFTWEMYLRYLFPLSGCFPCLRACLCSSCCSSRAAKRTVSGSAKGQSRSTTPGRSGSGGWGCPSSSTRITWMSRPPAALSPSAASLALGRTGVASREEDGKPPYWVRYCCLWVLCHSCCEHSTNDSYSFIPPFGHPVSLVLLAVLHIFGNCSQQTLND